MAEGQIHLESLSSPEERQKADTRERIAIEAATFAVEIAESAAGVPPMLLPDTASVVMETTVAEEADRLAEVRALLTSAANSNALQEVGEEVALAAVPEKKEKQSV